MLWASGVPRCSTSAGWQCSPSEFRSLTESWPIRTALANLFDLPTYCQYGMHRLAGPGFGAWRELAANIIVTEGVLAGDSESSPCCITGGCCPAVRLSHPSTMTSTRSSPRSAAAKPCGSASTNWAGAVSSLVLFFEYLPNSLLDRLTDPVGQAETLEWQLFEIVAFLKSRLVLHMDGHFANMLADDNRSYLVDFVLATSPTFELSRVERDYVARHHNHDGDFAAMQLVNWLVISVCAVPVPASGGPVARNAYVRRCASGDIPQDVPASVAGILCRHAPAAARMNEFHWRLYDGVIRAQYRAHVLGPPNT